MSNISTKLQTLLCFESSSHTSIYFVCALNIGVIVECLMHLVRRSVAEALVLAVVLFPYTNFVHPGSRRGPQNFTSNKLTLAAECF